MSVINTTLRQRTLRDPITAFQINTEIKEIKDLLKSLPIYFGTGTPESAVEARVGSIYLRLDGGSSTTFYVKESGDGTNTGWVGK